jgi:hypothetical protein
MIADYAESRKRSMGHNRVPTPFAGGPKAILKQEAKLQNLPFPKIDEDSELSEFNLDSVEKPQLTSHERKLTPFILPYTDFSEKGKSKESTSKNFSKFAQPIMEDEEEHDVDQLEFEFQNSSLYDANNRFVDQRSFE